MTQSSVDRARGLIIDPFAGISGDMLLGALVDLGLDAERLAERVGSLGLGARVVVDRVDRRGIDCARVRFELPEDQAHRHLEHVLEILAGTDLPARVRSGAESVFRRLATAEAAVHGVEVDEVHFHEVGALDSILDVVCGLWGVDVLGYRDVYTRPVAVGSGTVEIAHGRYPLPAPATARLLEGLVVRETGHAEECTTPTGAALLAEMTGGQAVPGDVVWGRSGYGAGHRDPEGRPNCLRLIECAVAEGAGEKLYLLQTDVDDLSAEYVAAARDALEHAGSVDVTVVRVDMKKGRPGVRLEALVPASSLEAVSRALFRGTSTIGLRYWPVERSILERSQEVVEWRGERIRVKAVRLPDGTVRRKPEYDDVVAAANAAGLTPHEVRLELQARGL